MTEPSVTSGSPDDGQPVVANGRIVDPVGSAPSHARLSKALLALVTVVTIGAVILRFLPRTSLWLDEALSVNIASLPIRDIPQALRHDGHPPLYYVLLHFWMRLFGDSDWSVRALSGTISTITVPLAYVAGRTLARRPGSELNDPRPVGLLAMALMAIMPFAVRYGAETRMYGLVMLLVTIGYPLVTAMLARPGDRFDGSPISGMDRSGSDRIGQDPVTDDRTTARPTTDRAMGSRRVTRLIATALVATGLLWTHYWTIWLLGAVGILAIATIWSRRNTEDRRHAWSGPIDLIVSLVVGGILFLPWLPTMLFQSAHTGTPWGERFGPFSMIVTTIVDFSGARFGAAQFLSYILVTLIVGGALVSLRRGTVADSLPRTEQPAASSTNEPPTGGSAVPVGISNDLDATEELIVRSRIVPRIRPELYTITLTLGIGWLASVLSHSTYSARYAAVVFPLFVLCIAAGLALIRHNGSTLIAIGVIAALCTYGALGSALADRTQVGRLVDIIESDMSDHAIDTEAVIVVCPDQLAVATQRVIDQRPPLRDAIGDVSAFPDRGDPRFVDWVDYGDINAAASPGEFVDRINASTGPDTTIYLIDSPHYLTLEGKCEGIIVALGAGRQSAVLQTLDTSGLDEAAELRVFRPPA